MRFHDEIYVTDNILGFSCALSLFLAAAHGPHNEITSSAHNDIRVRSILPHNVQCICTTTK